MAHREKVHALVLSRRDSGEADRIVTLLTRQQGLVRVLAKGVRKIPSRRGGHIEPLTQVVALLTGADRYRFLAGIEPVDGYVQLHQDPQALRHAEVLSRLIVGLLEPEHPYPELFDAMTHACTQLSQLPAAKQQVMEVTIGLYALQCAGLAPQLKHCQHCAANAPASAVIMDSQAGGWRCLTCHSSLKGTAESLSPRLLKALRWISKHPERALQLKITDSEGSQLLQTLRHYFAGVIEAPLTVGS